jgi:hypothetical protein
MALNEPRERKTPACKTGTEAHAVSIFCCYEDARLILASAASAWGSQNVMSMVQ